MENLNRRKFLKSGLIGAAGVATLSTDLVYGAPSAQKDKIVYRTLGKTGIKVPIVSMGVMNSENPSLVRAALDKGINFFDTANRYQNGRNEEMLGKVFKDYPRDSFILATKVRPEGTDRATGSPTKATTSEDFLAKFDTSLKRLQMNYVDILYMHNISSAEMVNFKPIVKAMQKLKKEGKVKFIGISTHNLPAIIDAMIESKTWDVVLATYNFLGQIQLNSSMPPPPPKEMDTKLIKEMQERPPMDPTMMKKMNEGSSVDKMDFALRKANEAGFGVVAMKTLAGGGFLDKERTKPINTTAAIKWVLNNPDVHSTIPGITDFDQLDLDIRIMADISMSDQEKKDIALAQVETGLYCTSCKNCLSGCKRNLPIPEIMRAYMYAYGYRNTGLAYDLLNELSAANNPCKTCDLCTATCSRRFNLKEKITDITRLIDVPSDFIS
jgi:uncharacterized protein